MVSGYGTRAGRISRVPTFHAGSDWLAPRGTNVYAMADGVVETVAHDSPLVQAYYGYGNAIVLRHDSDRVWTFYAHLDRSLVTRSQQVLAGQFIGKSGNTTNGRFPGMGPHLHTEVRHARPDGRSPFPGRYKDFNIDPVAWLATKGVSLGWRGGVPNTPCNLAGLGSLGAQVWKVRLAGESTAEDLDNSLSAEYEPPEEDTDWGLYAGLAAGGLALAGVVGVWLSGRR